MAMYVCDKCLEKYKIEAGHDSTVASCELCGYIDNQWGNKSLRLVKRLKRPFGMNSIDAKANVLEQLEMLQ